MHVDHVVRVGSRPRQKMLWSWLPAMLTLVVMFATWDYGSTSLYLGAIVPLHVIAADHLLRLCPASCFSMAVALSRFALLVPVLATTLR